MCGRRNLIEILLPPVASRRILARGIQFGNLSTTQITVEQSLSIPPNVRNLCPQRSFRYCVFIGEQMILKRRFKRDRRRRKRQLLNTSVQVFTESAQLDGLGINLSDVGMCQALRQLA